MLNASGVALAYRYYDPKFCRFISMDDISFADPESINGLNLYAYCGNNPVMYYDPNGTTFIGAFALLGILMLAGGVTGVAISNQNGYTGYEKLKTIVIGATLGLALGGGIIATGGVFVGAFASAGAKFLGLTALQAFALGALAIDFAAFVIAPLFGFYIEGIEYEIPTYNYGNINVFKKIINYN